MRSRSGLCSVCGASPGTFDAMRILPFVCATVTPAAFASSVATSTDQLAFFHSRDFGS